MKIKNKISVTSKVCFIKSLAEHDINLFAFFPNTIASNDPKLLESLTSTQNLY